MIEQLQRNQNFTENGKLTQRSVDWTRQVTQLDILEGSGSPEGVIEASIRRLYMDTAGTAGNILYIKRDADSAGDTSLGWVLI